MAQTRFPGHTTLPCAVFYLYREADLDYSSFALAKSAHRVV